MTGVLHDLVYVLAVVPALVVARRYRRLPPVVPISVRPNGTPFAHGPRWLIIFPALLVAIVLPLAALALNAPELREQRSEAGNALTYLLLIEVALFAALVLGLEAEVALGNLRRVPTSVQLAASAVLVPTVALVVLAR